jgi:FK506-binding nuclear protein
MFFTIAQMPGTARREEARLPLRQPGLTRAFAAIMGFARNVSKGGRKVELTFPPFQFRITMAAVDPTAPPEADEDGNIPAVPRSTLKLIRIPNDEDDEDDEDDDDDDEYLRALINASDDDDDEDEDDEANGGPSDPSKAKSKKQRRAEALASLIKAAKEEEESSDEEMADAKPNGSKKAAAKGKGKAKAVVEEEEEDEDEDDDSDDDDVIVPEEFVLCTLDVERVSCLTLSRSLDHV